MTLKKSTSAKGGDSALKGRCSPSAVFGTHGSRFGFEEQVEMCCLLTSFSFSA